jgi:hypothetical protein
MSICVLKIQNVGRSNLAIRQVYFEDVQNKGSSHHAEKYVHAVQTLCMKEGFIIATVKYRYAKIGPCCTKRHRPSLVWTISKSSDN